MTMNDPDTGFAQHPLRKQLLGELHARPFRSVTAPRVFLHYGFLTDEHSSARDREWFVQLCQAHGASGPGPATRHFVLAFGSGVLRWESHAEFTTYTWDGKAPAGAPFATTPDGSPFGRDFRAPGPMIVAARLDLVVAASFPTLEDLFDPMSIAASELAEAGILAATDFRADGDGLTRILVIDPGASRQTLGATCQRLLEVETYRMLALLGLPEAQRLAPEIRRIETGLSQITAEIRQTASLDANEALLHRLTQLTADLEAGAASSAYRFGAGRAYDEIVAQRLVALNEAAHGGHSTWRGFLSRRLRPAMRTCETTQDRQANLSRKLARAATLLRTRVDVELERQNRNLLEAMNTRARLQLRLQQTVEGLSVAAVSYYIVGLIGYFFKGVEHAGLPLDPTLAAACAVPFVLLVVWGQVRRIRRRHTDTE